MIHSVACNQYDCPWHRRGPCCRHPSAVHEDIPSTKGKSEDVPMLCPLLGEPDIVVVGQSMRDCEDQIVHAKRQLDDWLVCIGVAKRAANRKKSPCPK